MRNDSRSYRSQHNWKPVLQTQPAAPPAVSQGQNHSQGNMDKGNFRNQRKSSWESPSQPRNSLKEPPRRSSAYLTNNNEQPKNLTNQPASKPSFGPGVRRVESMKRIMQKNRKAENNNSPSVSNSLDGGEGEVVTEKGRSVKSIVGMFDQQPAIHAALAKAKMKQANELLKDDQNTPADTTETPCDSFSSQRASQQSSTNSGKNDRNGTQVVHIAKFVQLDTPEKANNYTDAQTSPMQLSPTEPLNLQHGRPSIAKAETFGGQKPKVAVITSSTSSGSYMSNDVFTPCTDSIESPVFETEPSYYRTDSSGRTQYSDSAVSPDGYDLAHNSYIPNSHSQPYSIQHPHIHNQVSQEIFLNT